MGGFAWVTLATNDSYSLGALVLAHSLRQSGTPHQLAVLVTPGVTGSMREKLGFVFNVVQEVNILDSKDEANLKLLKRPELGITFTKLHCWRLTQFEKCIFLDADTLVLQNCDELFEREEFSAAPDVGWPDCFNSGVFVYRPSNETYEKLVQFALDKGSFDGGDQGLLNLYFSDWAHKDISKHLPFIYNMCSTACYSYLPAFKQFGTDVKIVHFISSTKPWLQYFDTETRQVQPSNDMQHLKTVMQCWWDIFCSLIHPNLSTEMSRPSNESNNLLESAHSLEILDHCSSPPISFSGHSETQQSDYRNVWDPWKDYDNAQIETEQSPSHINCEIVETHNTNSQVYNEPDESFYHPVTSRSPSPKLDHLDTRISENFIPHEQTDSNLDVNVEYNFAEQFDSHHSYPEQYEDQKSCTETSNQNELPNVIKHDITENQFDVFHTPPQSIQIPEFHVNSINDTKDPLPIEYEANTLIAKEISITKLNDQNEDGGLAGAFAQFTLGSPRSPTQNALEDHLRRQGWEVGNIDYMGRDSFDNIWSKICETLSSAETVPTSEITIKSEGEEAKPNTEIESKQAQSEVKASESVVEKQTEIKQDDVKAEEVKPNVEPKSEETIITQESAPQAADLKSSEIENVQSAGEISPPAAESAKTDLKPTELASCPKPEECAKPTDVKECSTCEKPVGTPVSKECSLATKPECAECPKQESSKVEEVKSAEGTPKSADETPRLTEECNKQCEQITKQASIEAAKEEQKSKEAANKPTEGVEKSEGDASKLPECAKLPGDSNIEPIKPSESTAPEAVTPAEQIEKPIEVEKQTTEPTKEVAADVTKETKETTKPAEDISKSIDETPKQDESAKPTTEEIAKSSEENISKTTECADCPKNQECCKVAKLESESIKEDESKKTECKDCPKNEDCCKPKETEVKECTKDCKAQEPNKPEENLAVPKTPEIIEATPPTTPAVCEKPAEIKALIVEQVIPATPPPTTLTEQTPATPETPQPQSPAIPISSESKIEETPAVSEQEKPRVEQSLAEKQAALPSAPPTEQSPASIQSEITSPDKLEEQPVVETSSSPAEAKPSPIAATTETTPASLATEITPAVLAAEATAATLIAETTPTALAAETTPVAPAAETTPVAPAAETTPASPKIEPSPVSSVPETSPASPAAVSSSACQPAEASPIPRPAEQSSTPHGQSTKPAPAEQTPTPPPRKSGNKKTKAKK